MCDDQAVKHTVLIVEDEVLARTALAEYLRQCGYRVIQASCTAEAMTVLKESQLKTHIVFNAIPCFKLSKWVQQHRPELKMVMAGNLEKAAHAVGDLCEDGPQLENPYEPQQVIDWIKRLQASA